MSFLGVRNASEQKIHQYNMELLRTRIPPQYYQDFFQCIGMKKTHEREITVDEINIYLSQHPNIRQTNPTVQTQQVKTPNKVLYTEDDSDEAIKNDIEDNMNNLAGHESGTSWMKWGAMFGGNAADQITAAGFKALIEQNKILIRQNELIRRQNDKIIKLLSKDKE